MTSKMGNTCYQNDNTKHNKTQHYTTRSHTTQRHTTSHNIAQHNTTRHDTRRHKHETTRHDTTQHKTRDIKKVLFSQLKTIILKGRLSQKNKTTRCDVAQYTALCCSFVA